MYVQPDIIRPFATTEGTTKMDELLTPTLVEGELRIRDADLGERLGYSDPTQIRELIDRHKESVSKISILRTMRKITGGKAGRPANEYYLNRKQAIFVTAKSETETATDITIEIIERFDAYERGVLRTEQRRLSEDDCKAIGDIIEKVLKDEMQALLQEHELFRPEIAALQVTPTAPRALAVDGNFWPMRRVVQAAGVNQVGRGRLVHRCAAAMKKWCVKTGRHDAVQIVTDGDGNDHYTFAAVAVKEWLAEMGNDIISAHHNRGTGA
jgi:phage regulator Rha-like protein